jgi:hypothetical protein
LPSRPSESCPQPSRTSSSTTPRGNILENDELLASLNETQAKAGTIAAGLQESARLAAALEEQRAAYAAMAEVGGRLGSGAGAGWARGCVEEPGGCQPGCNRDLPCLDRLPGACSAADPSLLPGHICPPQAGSRLFFLLRDLPALGAMYHFALPAFMGLFRAALRLETPAASVPMRIAALRRHLVELVYTHAARWGARHHRRYEALRPCTKPQQQPARQRSANLHLAAVPATCRAMFNCDRLALGLLMARATAPEACAPEEWALLLGQALPAAGAGAAGAARPSWLRDDLLPAYQVRGAASGCRVWPPPAIASCRATAPRTAPG